MSFHLDRCPVGIAMCGAYRVCIDDPTARGAAKFLKTIREAIEGLLAATTAVLAMCCHQDRGGMVSIEGKLTPAQRLLGCSLCQHLEWVKCVLSSTEDNREVQARSS